MRTLKNYLESKKDGRRFKDAFDEEKQLLDVSLQLLEARRAAGYSQSEIARAAHVTQQQVSRVENGINCNILTYLKVGHAMGLELAVRPVK